MHDGLRINQGDDASVQATPRGSEKQRLSMLRQGLQGIPEPQYEYGVELPPAQAADAEDAGDAMEEDARDADMRQIKAVAAEKAEELRQRSDVLKRELPRPSTINKRMFENVERDTAQGLVGRMMLRLMKYDSVKFPHEGAPSKKKKRKKKRKVPQLAAVTPTELKSAQDLIAAEVTKMGGDGPDAVAAFEEAWTTSVRDRVYVPSKDAFMKASVLPKAELLAAAHHEFKSLVQDMQRQSNAATKLEKKLNIVLKGHARVHGQLTKKFTASQKELDEMVNEKLCFERLMQNEQRALPQRLERARVLLVKEEERGRDLQRRYKGLEREHRTLWVQSQEMSAAS